MRAFSMGHSIERHVVERLRNGLGIAVAGRIRVLCLDLFEQFLTMHGYGPGGLYAQTNLIPAHLDNEYLRRYR